MSSQRPEQVRFLPDHAYERQTFPAPWKSPPLACSPPVALSSAQAALHGERIFCQDILSVHFEHPLGKAVSVHRDGEQPEILLNVYLECPLSASM